MKTAARCPYDKSLTDDGMSIIGVVIASVLILLTLIPAADLIENTLAISSDNQHRVVAANLATQQMEQIRAQAQGNFSTLLSNYSITASTASASSSSTVNVGQMNYTVKTTLSWSSSNFAQGGCSSNFSSGYSASSTPPVLEAAIAVTWPNQRLSQPVTLSEALNAPSSLFGGSDGSVLVSVVNAAGLPQATVPVTLEDSNGLVQSSSTTDVNGCAFFPNVSPSSSGPDKVTISAPSDQDSVYVDQSDIPNPIQSTTVSAGVTSALQFTYDQGSYLEIQGAPQTQIASEFGLSANNNYLTTQGDSPLALTVSSDNFKTSPAIFPATSGYQTWLGTCTGFSPASTVPLSVSVTPGGTSNLANLAYSTLAASFVNSSSTPVAANTALSVYVWQYPTLTSTSSCTPSPIAIPVTTDANGNAVLNLPNGYFALAAVTAGSSAPTAPTTSIIDATNTPPGGAPVTITVNS